MLPELEKKVDEVLKVGPEQLGVALPPMLDDIRKYGIGEMLEKEPALLLKIIRKLLGSNVAKFANEAPEAMDKFIDFLWESLNIAAEKSAELRQVFENAGEIWVNLEATDSPFEGRFKISQGKLSGGSGLFPFREQSFKYWGPTEILMKLLIGDINIGLERWLSLNVEGHPGFAKKLGPVFRSIANTLKAE